MADVDILYKQSLEKWQAVNETENNRGTERSEYSAGGEGFGEAFTNILDDTSLSTYVSPF